MSSKSPDLGSPADDHKPSYTTSYVPFTSPPTPSPSPSPQLTASHCTDGLELALRDIRPRFTSFSVQAKNSFLAELLSLCPAETLAHVYNIITPRIKRDFLRDLPLEIALHAVSFINDARSLTRASAVSKYWRALLTDEYLWKNMCKVHKYCSDRVTGSGVAVSGGVCLSPRARVVRRLSIADSETEDEAREAVLGAIDSLSLSDSETVSTEDMDMDIDYTDEHAVLRAEAMDQAAMSLPLPQRRPQGRDSDITHNTRTLDLSPLPPRLAAEGSSPLRKQTKQDATARSLVPFSYKQHFKISYLTGSYKLHDVPFPSA